MKPTGKHPPTFGYGYHWRWSVNDGYHKWRYMTCILTLSHKRYWRGSNLYV